MAKDIQKLREEKLKQIDLEVLRISSWLNKDQCENLDYFILSLLLESNISYQEAIGTLEEAKLQFREIIMSSDEDEDDN